MNFATIQAAILVAVRTALGLSENNSDGRPIHSVVWAKSMEAGGYRPTVRVDLLLRAPQGLGSDETRQAYNALSDAIELSQAGIRMLPVEVRIESDTQTPGTSESVGGLANRLRTRLYFQGVLAALRTAGVAVNLVRPTQEAEYTRDGRKIAVSITEVLFSAAEFDTDTTEGAGDYIEHVTVASSMAPLLLGEDGITPTQEQVNVVIPPE